MGNRTLADLVRLNHNNNRVEQKDEELLALIKQFDPNASFNETGSNDGYNYQLNYDPSKLPENKVNKNKGVFGTVPVYQDNRDHYYTDSAFMQDDNYGEITDSRNYKPPQDFLDKYGPLIGTALVTMGAPMVGAALAGAGIGGTAGLTAGLTGSGISGAGSQLGTSLVRNIPNIGRQVSSGNYGGAAGNLASSILRAYGQRAFGG